MKKFQVTFLGTGTSTGTPIIGCKCTVCMSKDSKDKRTRTSVYIKTSDGTSFVIDTGPDLRHQLLRENIDSCDFAIITHDHSDHLHGIDDLRPFTFLPKRRSMPVFSSNIHIPRISSRFDYIFKREELFNKRNPYRGGGLPLLNLHSLDELSSFFPDLEVEYFHLPHGTGFTSGLIFSKRFAYIIDCHEIPATALQKLQDLKLKCLVIDCLQINDHPRHLTVEKSFNYIEKIKPTKAYLIHMNHDLSHRKLDEMARKRFGNTVFVSYDGLSINV
tara:strand:- start:313 stop:1134 length:822 start_codon:yes stop_codon:yes gene_type:complete